jgi:hypothetical protein
MLAPRDAVIGGNRARPDGNRARRRDNGAYRVGGCGGGTSFVIIIIS